ncbi:Hypothetical predicted protein [Olea europaea subsp. europaea]|uniref:Uncharacterized protein n=1 Tax=Olea europaea subsp. europaea TaxID=158383 RepID=A0A8S0V767_OLEEU|nr:Hypothetical predicted protein [Olea europaea subsp. europaea]
MSTKDWAEDDVGENQYVVLTEMIVIVQSGAEIFICDQPILTKDFQDFVYQLQLQYQECTVHAPVTGQSATPTWTASRLTCLYATATVDAGPGLTIFTDLKVEG